jgi:hypothetical protein
MRVYVVLIISDREPTRIFGVFKDKQAAFEATSKFAQESAERGDDSWYADLEECEVQEDAADDIDLQQQVEALQAYVGVLQKHILCLTDAVARILHIPDIKKGVGENGTRNLLKHLAEGRRTTWEEK